jgi:WD40 repeat protein
MPDSQYDVFLSYENSDKEVVEALAHRLVLEGVTLWIDIWNLIPGMPWQEAVESALNVSNCCVVCIGQSGISYWQNEVMRVALDRRISVSGGMFRVIPVLLPTATRGDYSLLPDFLRDSVWVEFRTTLQDINAFHRLLSGIRGVEPGPGTDEAMYADITPYRGLRMFDVDDWPFFFGREALVERLLDTLGKPSGTQPEKRFLGIIGPSGSGKSSIARAGLIASMKQGKIPGSERWGVAITRPGSDPALSLARAICSVDQEEPDTETVQNLRQSLLNDNHTLHLVASLTARSASTSYRLVILVDQFEELFTLCQDEQHRQKVIENLLYAATMADGPTIVLITLRADFYGKCAAYTTLAVLLSNNNALVGAMTKWEIRRSIVRPAVLAGSEFEQGLVEKLLRDVEGQIGSLPLLQDVLLELWNRRTERKLTHDAYRQVGGVGSALEGRAEQVFAQLNVAEQALCKHLFLQLIQPGDGTDHTSRRAELGELLGSTDDQTVAASVLLKLASDDARLLTIGSNLAEAEDDPSLLMPTRADLFGMREISVEVVHEALVHSWKRLRNWIEADRVALRLAHRIAEDARTWNRGQRDPSYLYHGAQLVEAQDWLINSTNTSTVLQRSFIEASTAARDAAQQMARRRFRWTIGGLGFAIMVISGIALVAIQQWSMASALSSRNLARLLMAEGGQLYEQQPLLAVRTTLEALAVVSERDQELRAAAVKDLASMASHGRLMRIGTDGDGIAVSPDNKTFVLARKSAPAELRRVADGALLATLSGRLGRLDAGQEGDISSIDNVTYSPDGSVFIVPYLDAPGEVRRTEDGVLVAALKDTLSPHADVIFSPQGTAFLVTYDSGVTELRRTIDGSLIIELQLGILSKVKFSPNEFAFVVEYFDKPGELRRLNTGDLITVLTEEVNAAGTVFSPDGENFIVPYGITFPGMFHGVRGELRRTKDGTIVTRLTGTIPNNNSDTVPSFNYDGTAFIVYYADAVPEVRSTATGAVIPTSRGIDYVKFSPQGHFFVIEDDTYVPSSTPGYVEEKDRGPTEVYRTVDGLLITSIEDVPYDGITFGPKDDAFVVRFEDESGELRRTTDGSVITYLTGVINEYDVDFNLDGSVFAVGYSDKFGELRRTSDGTTITTFDGVVGDQRFSPDGSVIIVDLPSSSELRRADSGALISTLTSSFLPSFYAYFSPQGTAFVANYDPSMGGQPRIRMSAELRKIDGSAVVTLTNLLLEGGNFDPDSVFYNGNETLFVVKNDNTTGELWDIQGTPRLITVFGLGLEYVVFEPTADTVLVQQNTGETYLIDVRWLRTLKGNPGTLSEEDLIRSICEGPLRRNLLTSDEVNTLTRMLNGAQAQSCLRLVDK